MHQITHNRYEFDRNSISPKHHEQYIKCTSTKQSYPLDYKPNINDLRQLFDDNSRHENRKNLNRDSAIYGDAKHTSLHENIFDCKNYHRQSQSIVTAAIPTSRSDFERVKQKFDKPNASNSPSSSSRNNKKARNYSSFLKFNNKRSESVPNESVGHEGPTKVPQNISLTESVDSIDSTKAIVGDSLTNKKKDVYMNSSMNLDGLKVSEDEDDVSNKMQ